MTYQTMRIFGLAIVATLPTGGACSSSSSAEQDAMPLADVPSSLEGGSPSSPSALDLARPAGPPTLATGVDPARLAADVAPAVAEFIRGTPAELLAQLGLSLADAVAIEMGRPYGIFTLHKGPWLAFEGYWQVPILANGAYRCIADVKLAGDSLASDGYVLVGLGHAQSVAELADREKLPKVSAALDVARAGLLRLNGAGGTSLLAYEVASADAGAAPDIMVQSLGWYPSEIPGIDGSVPPEESTLAEIDATLPAE